ncbi:hypothetical protein D9757_010427 [Collybiopsis confluens]|uniref:DUF6533 domain-containing protein n=1 Tax=Collybiopsis confluens TaxID=2823264 RepID=A0A8H5GPB8_9AGAR|nr:hypothetical protein D9757_010427 [Collybiopsis confluens]
MSLCRSCQEVQFIWRAKWRAPKILFLLVRYIVPVGVILHSHRTFPSPMSFFNAVVPTLWSELSGIANSDVTDTPRGEFSANCGSQGQLRPINSNTLCRQLMLSELTTGMGNFLVMLHVWNLWERNRILIVASLILFTLTQIANIICGVISVINITFYLWAPGLLFELAMFAAVYLNAGARPRTLQTEFSKVLHRDGMVYFAVLLTLRLTNLVLAIVSPLRLV